MLVANEASVAANFNSFEFESAEEKTTFLRQDREFLVRTGSETDNDHREFSVTHTFGVAPLQQYLVNFPGGRRQAVNLAWDTRDAAEGGQRWFHLYPNEAIKADDPLHWTGRFFNWNSMCGECHSTNLVKAYDLSSNTYQTTYSEVSVGCEACHGPGSRHAADPAVSLSSVTASERNWILTDGQSIATLAAERSSTTEIETCAVCHSRRSQLTDDHEGSQPLLDGYRPALLDVGLYHADGQIMDEVYVYGSFLQSAMYAAGVICSDCHEPHGARLRTEGNALCTRCHATAVFDTEAHHRHDASRQCVDCHMRSETYMVVDPRRDHSFRVPRPDVSQRVGSPNACNDCHAERTAAWAASRIADWYPDGRHNEPHYGDALQAGRDWSAGYTEQLQQVFDDDDKPAIIRATALDLLGRQIDNRVIERIDAALHDRVPLLRLTAVEQTARLPPALRIRLATPLLDDPLLAVRTAAASALLEVRTELRGDDLQSFRAALDEYIGVQTFNADQPEGLTALAGIAAAVGDSDRAETYLQASMRRHPNYAAAYANLADLYRVEGREQDARDVLETGLGMTPDEAGLHLALGLSLIRSNRQDEALPRLETAAELSPDVPDYRYISGIALHSFGNTDRAIGVLEESHERFPGHRDTLLGLATILRDAGRMPEALTYAQKLQALAPADPAARALIQELSKGLRP